MNSHWTPICIGVTQEVVIPASATELQRRGTNAGIQRIPRSTIYDSQWEFVIHNSLFVIRQIVFLISCGLTSA